MKEYFKLSIIILVHIEEKYFNSGIKSVFFLKKYINFKEDIEVIIIDDFSKDSSSFLINKWKKKIKNLKVIKLKKKLGPSYARNLGIKLSLGKYIFFLDGDDYIISNNFKYFFNLINAKIQKDIYLFHNIVENNNFVIKPKITKKNYKSFCKCIVSLNSEIVNFNVWRFFLKKSFLIKNRIYFKDINQFEDWVFNAELILNNPEFIEIKKFLYSYNFKFKNSETKKIDPKNLLNTISAYLYIEKINTKISDKQKKTTISDMLKMLRMYIFMDLFLIKINKLFFFKKKFPFISKIIKKNINFRRKINNKNKKFLIFCAGRLGRNLTFSINKKKLCKFIIDSNNGLDNNNFNGYSIKNFTFFLKNIKKFINYYIIIANLNKRSILKIKRNIVNAGINKSKIIYF